MKFSLRDRFRYAGPSGDLAMEAMALFTYRGRSWRAAVRIANRLWDESARVFEILAKRDPSLMELPEEVEVDIRKRQRFAGCRMARRKRVAQ